LGVRGQYVGGLGHEMHPAEHDVLGPRHRGCLPGELERVASHVSEPDDLVALVVMAKHECAGTQRGARALSSRDQVGIRCPGQFTWTGGAALAAAGGPGPEQERGKRAVRAGSRPAVRAPSGAGLERHGVLPFTGLIVELTIPPAYSCCYPAVNPCAWPRRNVRA